MADKTWTGKVTRMAAVRFSHKAGKLGHSFSGEADVYRFEPEDRRCKVRYLAVIRGVSPAVMAGSSGDVGAAVLKAAALSGCAKNAPLSAEHDTYPEPVGCPEKRLEGHLPEQALAFYEKPGAR